MSSRVREEVSCVCVRCGVVEAVGEWGTYRVEEVDDGDKGGVEDGPDDVEFPLQGLDAYGCDLDDLPRGRRISPS